MPPPTNLNSDNLNPLHLHPNLKYRTQKPGNDHVTLKASILIRLQAKAVLQYSLVLFWQIDSLAPNAIFLFCRNRADLAPRAKVITQAQHVCIFWGRRRLDPESQEDDIQTPPP